MIRLGLILIAASCGKGDSTKGTASKSDVPAFDPSGVVITAKDVAIDGKSLGILPEGLVTDRQLYVDTLDKRTGPIMLAYSDDAAGPAVLGALRGINELAERHHPPPPAAGSAPPPPDSNEDPDVGRQMAIDEARRAGTLGSRPGPRTEFKISAFVGGKPTEICRAMTASAPDPDDENVELVAQIGRNNWSVGISRVNETTKVASAADLEGKLREQKSSAFFKDRDDAELAAAPDATGADVTPVIADLCKIGFRALRPLSEAEATAQLGESTETRPAKVPTLSIGQPVVNGELDKAILRRYIKRHVGELEACYTHELAKKPSLAGTVSTQFTISPEGTVAESNASGVDPAVATCVARAIKAIEFPKPKSGSVQVNYPFSYRPAH